MADVFTKAGRSEAFETQKAEGGAPNGRSGLEFSEIELIAGDPEVLDDVRNDAARHVAWMPREGDEAVGSKRIGVMPVTAGRAKKLTTDFTESPFQLKAIPGGIFAHKSGSENEFVAEGHRNWAASFEQCFQMDFGGLLKAEGGFATVASVGVATGQGRRFGNPHAVLILTDLHFRERNDHGAAIITRGAPGVKRAFDD